MNVVEYQFSTREMTDFRLSSGKEPYYTLTIGESVRKLMDRVHNPDTIIYREWEPDNPWPRRLNATALRIARGTRGLDVSAFTATPDFLRDGALMAADKVSLTISNQSEGRIIVNWLSRFAVVRNKLHADKLQQSEGLTPTSVIRGFGHTLRHFVKTGDRGVLLSGK